MNSLKFKVAPYPIIVSLDTLMFLFTPASFINTRVRQGCESQVYSRMVTATSRIDTTGLGNAWVSSGGWTEPAGSPGTAAKPRPLDSYARSRSKMTPDRRARLFQPTASSDSVFGSLVRQSINTKGPINAVKGRYGALMTQNNTNMVKQWRNTKKAPGAFTDCRREGQGVSR